MPKDLQELPKLRDSISYIYIEHAIIEQDALSIVIIKEDGKIPVEYYNKSAVANRRKVI